MSCFWEAVWGLLRESGREESEEGRGEIFMEGRGGILVREDSTVVTFAEKFNELIHRTARMETPSGGVPG